MKKIICFVLCVCFFGGTIFAQGRASLVAKNTPDPVKWVNQQFAGGKIPDAPGSLLIRYKVSNE
ncbi:MAG: hypothetical protein LBR86_05885 [Tannerella sp.]|jgi:hypothetical protein|nr:hypothetical protein [Tannerella sp.]